MSRKFYAVNRRTGERWSPKNLYPEEKQFLVLYDSGYAAVVSSIPYDGATLTPLDPKEWELVVKPSLIRTGTNSKRDTSGATMLDVRHRPLLCVDETLKELQRREQCQFKYVCTTATSTYPSPRDIYYRSSPHPEFGNQYFGLSASHIGSGIKISNADHVVDLVFQCIPVEGSWYYSQCRHDFNSVNGEFIDGGREYTRASLVSEPFQIINGEFVKVSGTITKD